MPTNKKNNKDLFFARHTTEYIKRAVAIVCLTKKTCAKDIDHKKNKAKRGYGDNVVIAFV